MWKTTKLLFLAIITVFCGIFLFLGRVKAANPGDILINEVAWMGSEVSSADEWIELRNTTGSPIDLTDWTLIAGDGTPSIELAGIIDEYFLLERTDDYSVPEVIADLIYSGALGNSGENLKLLDSEGNIIDEIICDGVWLAGDNTAKLTMERKIDLSWQNSVEASGTPKAENSTGETEEPPEEPPTEEPEPPEEPPADPVEYSDKIIINEIFPNPEDENLEWVELKNIGVQAIDLENWYISDGSGKIFTISTSTASSTIISANNFYILEKNITNIALNNSGDIVNLYQPNDNLLESVEYEETFEEWSYSRDEDGSWSWTTSVTKNTENEFSVPEPETPPASGGSTGGSSNQSPQSSNQQSQTNYSNDIIISEFLPNPEGSDSQEWIELYNKGNMDIDLAYWQIGDNSSRKYTISGDKTIIKANSYFLLPRQMSAIALNNTGGDTISLYQPNGNLSEKIDYSEKAIEGFAYALLNNNWHWTSTPTPEGQNVITQKNELPIVSFEIDGNLVDTNIMFDASESYDPEGEGLIFNWQFGDCTDAKFCVSTTTPIIIYRFNTSGSYNIKLTVEDSEGQAVTVDKELIISSGERIEGIKEIEEIIITEILPNPAGSDTDLEWIEIFNRGIIPVNLANWQIDDGEKGSQPYTISDTLIINPGEYLVFDRPTTRLAYNNSYDSARLFDPIGNIIDEVSYDEVIEDASYALDALNTWHWTYALTPGMENIVNIMTVPAMATKKQGVESDYPVQVELKNIRSFDFGDLVTTQGTVAVEPGTLGKNIFYIIDDNTGIQIYCYKKDFPLLGIGDVVAITGSLSESRTENRLKIKTGEDITVLNKGTEFPAAFPVQIEDIDENFEGALIQITGELTEVKGSSWWLDDNTEEVKIYIKQSTQIKKGDIAMGDTLNVTGIVSEWDEEYRVLPRWSEDVVVVKKVLGASDNKPQDTINKTQPSNYIFKYLFVVACAIIVILGSVIIKQRKKS